MILRATAGTIATASFVPRAISIKSFCISITIKSLILIFYEKFAYSAIEERKKSKIHIVRGLQVMLDSDLAEIYGYSTKAFNQQIKNNKERFDEDFMFQLTKSDDNHANAGQFGLQKSD
nr:ORF6N domain-containing protein [Treponema sp.]